MPRSPSRVSRPSGSAATKPSAWAVRSAAHTVVVGHVGAERDVAAHGVVEEERLLRHQRGVLGELRRRPGRAGRAPSSSTCPSSGSTSRSSSEVSVLLPLAVAPTTATVRPGATVKREVVEQRRARRS